jgi:hypothetical protein
LRRQCERLLVGSGALPKECERALEQRPLLGAIEQRSCERRAQVGARLDPDAGCGFYCCQSSTDADRHTR